MDKPRPPNYNYQLFYLLYHPLFHEYLFVLKAFLYMYHLAFGMYCVLIIENLSASKKT